MTKIAIIGDLHLGYNFGSEQGEDAFRNAKFALDKARDVDLIILLGDIFDTKIPKPEILDKAIALFKSVKKPVVTIYGTHEKRGAEAVNPVQLLERIGLLTLLHKTSFTFKDVVVYGLSGVPDMFARDELKAWSPKPVAGAFNIFLLHQTFKEVIPEIPDDILTYDDLPAGFDLYVDGHIHWRQEGTVGGAPILYTGSTVVTQMKKLESTQSKGLFILDVNGRKFTKRFIEVPQRPFYYLDLDVNGKSPADIINSVCGALNEQLLMPSELKPQIKVKIKGKLAKGFVPTDVSFSKLIKQYAEKCFLSIDKSKVVSDDLEEQALLIANLKSREASIEDIGIGLLCKQLEGVDKNLIRALFERLAQ